MRPARAARLAFQLPTESRTLRAIQPANEWGWREVLLNNLAYSLDVLIWQNSNEGVKKAKQTPQPKPFIPPFMRDLTAERAINKDSKKHTVDDIKNILAKPRKAAPKAK